MLIPPEYAMPAQAEVVSYALPANQGILYPGNQDGCDGWVSEERVRDLCARLQSRTEPGVIFSERKASSRVYGGVCTAMAISFITTYLRSRGNLYKDRLYSTSLEMKELQAALNTIELVSPQAIEDPGHSKIQSVLNSFDLRAEPVPGELDMRGPGVEDFLRSALADRKGVILIRILLPSDNERLEERGHTLVYISENSMPLLYDPNQGLWHLVDCDPIEVLRDLCGYCSEVYGVYMLRLYQLFDTSSSTEK